MRLAGIAALLLVAGGVALAARQFAHKEEPRARNVVKVVSTAPRHVAGGYDLRDVALLSDEEVWAVGYDDEHTRRLYHSHDGGGTWEAVDVLGNGATFTSVGFPDAEHGWAVGGGGLVIRTADGGKSWELLKPPTKVDLQVVHFINSRVGFIGGREALLDSATDEVTGSAEILRTTDGGRTWRRCYREERPGNFFQITSFSDSVAVAILDGNRLLRTEDRGETWMAVPLSARYVTSAATAPDGVNWFVGPQGGLQSSDDGGKTWRQSASQSPDAAGHNWEAISFNGRGQGLAVGESGTVALTSDNGKTWEVFSIASSDDLRAIRMHGSTALILGASKLYRVRL